MNIFVTLDLGYLGLNIDVDYNYVFIANNFVKVEQKSFT